MECADVPGLAGRTIVTVIETSNNQDLMQTKPILLFLVAEDWYFCSHRLPLAVAAQKSGYDVAVITRVTAHGDVIRDAGIRVIPLKYLRRASMNPFRELMAIWEIFNIYRKERPALVHHVALKPVLYGTLSARLAGVAGVINAMAGLGFVFSSNRRFARVIRPILIQLFRFLLNRQNAHLIVQNADDMKLLLDHGISDINRTHLIRGAGVDMLSYSPSPIESDVPLVMLASRMLWDKGVGEFVTAASILKSKGVNARFVLVGDTDVENPTAIPRRQLEQWHADNVVEWWGYRADMAAILPQAHVFCLPSFYGEGIPKVLIEAAACARPIVTTNMPGCREMVQDGVNGYLVPPRDVDALVNALAKLVGEIESCARMGFSGRQIAEAEFDVQRIVAETLQVYEYLNPIRKSYRSSGGSEVAQITVSIVSHGHLSLLDNLLLDIADIPEIAAVILTLNVPEPDPEIPPKLAERLTIIRNHKPKGFSANHNAAFRRCQTPHFCVMNPDIRLNSNPFTVLLNALASTGRAMVAPIVMNSQAEREDSVRHFPTPWKLLQKIVIGDKGTYDIRVGDKALYPDWVAGMFMLFDSDAFDALNGFDDSYFLYYEDVDICVRLWKAKLGLLVCPDVVVSHDAQRTSHKRLMYLRWHITSMLRFFIKHLGRLPAVDADTGSVLK